MQIHAVTIPCWLIQCKMCSDVVLVVKYCYSPVCHQAVHRYIHRWDSLIHKLNALRASWALGVVAQKRFRQSGCHFAVLWGLLAGFDTVETPAQGKILVQFLYFHLQ